MPRVSHAVASLKRKKRIFKKVRGFWGGRSRLYRTAKETLQRSMAFATRDRRDRKGVFRRLWITRINAACKEHDMSYSRFIDGLKKAKISIDRKMLAELAVNDRPAFTELVKVAKDVLKPKASKLLKPKAK